MRALERRAVLLLLAVSCLPAAGGSSGETVVPPAARFRVSLEVVANPADGPPRSGCDRSEVAPADGLTWWATFGETRARPEGGWQADAASIACGTGAPPSAGAPYLTARLKTITGFLPSMLTPERVLLLDLTLSIQKLSGFSKEGTPLYDSSETRRSFYFEDGREAVVPILVAGDAEMQAFGVREVFVHLTMRPADDDASAAAYGSIAVLSGPAGGEILLDGGVAGILAASGGTILRNVKEGVHEVRARAASTGSGIGKAVQVIARRTVLVDLSPRDAAPESSPYQVVPLGRNAQGFEEYRRGRDNAVVVRIPAGEIHMGNRKTEGAPLEHEVYVSEFMLDKLPVTWRQFKKFSEATGIPLPPHDPYWGIHDDHPAVYITWEEGKTYCEWAGGRLPTEAEREKGARGTDTRKFPWGDEEPDHSRGVFRHEWGWEATEAVGTHPAGVSPYGLLDMGGNVWEYCSDWFDRDYYQTSPSRDPKGPTSGSAHVVRGGSWDSRPTVLSSSCRNWGHRGYREGDFGFRCAMSPPR